MNVNRRIAEIAIIAIAMLAVLAAFSTPAMAVCYCDVSQDCPGSKNGTVNGEVYLTNVSQPGAGSDYWEFEVPSGTVQWAQIHWYSWGAEFPATATFCNETACQDMTFEYNATCEQNETCGYWVSGMGSHHFFWTVNASSGTNNLTLETDHFDARWKFFVAVINGTTTTKHNGKYWVNNGFQKPVEIDTWFNDSDILGNINTSANHTLTTFISHYDNVTIEFNDNYVNYYGQYDCGMMYSNGLTKDTIDNSLISGSSQKMTWDDTTTCTGDDDYFTYIAVLAEEGTSVSYPDLTVAAIDIIPGTPRPNTNFTINATIQNVGTADATNQSNVSLYINNVFNKTKTIEGLNASNSTTVSFKNISLSEDCYTFKVVADADGNVTESAETNNASSKKSQVGYVIVVKSDSDFDKLVDESKNETLGDGNVSKDASGTYHIRNFTSIENCVGNGITIENTNAKFVINNCTIRNCSVSGVYCNNISTGTGTINGSVMQNNSKYGIKVGVVPLSSKDPDSLNITDNTITENKLNGIDLIGFNCTVKDNNVTNNSVYGIYVLGNDSNITNNNITNNDGYGVKLYNSTGNYVYANNFTNNNVSGHQAWDNRATNYWNTTDAGKNYTGSYWKDWQNNNGFPSSYEIDGGSNKDKRPKGLYDFITGESEDKWAYRFNVDAIKPDTNDVPNTEFTDAQYVQIKVDDNEFQSDETGNSPGSGGYAAHRFNFSIAEPESSITKINVTWKGKGWHDDTTGADQGAKLYIWNGTGYDELDDNDDANEVTLTGENASSASNYINAGNVTVLVVQKTQHVSKGNKASHIETNYVIVAICATP